MASHMEMWKYHDCLCLESLFILQEIQSLMFQYLHENKWNTDFEILTVWDTCELGYREITHIGTYKYNAPVHFQLRFYTLEFE